MARLLNLIILTSIAAVCYSINVSYNQVGDVRISYDGRLLLCDRLTCPDNAERCIVTKRTLPDDRTKIERWARCLSSDNKILLEDKQIYANALPNADVNVYVEHGIHGTVAYYNDSQTQQMVENTLAQIHRNLEHMQEDLSRQLNQLGKLFNGFL